MPAPMTAVTRLRYPFRTMSRRRDTLHLPGRPFMLAAVLLAGGCGGGADGDAAAAVDPADHRCVALAMYWEARGEGEEGMRAIGAVIRNRMEDERFPDTACAVVREGGETPPCQFSWWCDGRHDSPAQGEPWETSQELAREVLTGRPRDPTGGALYFHHAASDPPWTKERTARIGDHVFYR